MTLIINYLLILIGLALGWVTLSIEKIFYIYQNSHELHCVRFTSKLISRNFKEAWQMLKETQAGDKSPIRNILTMGILGVLGIWGILSLGNKFVPALIVGLYARMVWLLWIDINWQKWYWLFAREFEIKEHQIIRYILSFILIMQLFLLVR